MTKIISNQLDHKLGQFMPEELGLVLRKIKKGKLQVLKYPKKCGRQGNSKTYSSDTATPYITRTQKTDGTH